MLKTILRNQGELTFKLIIKIMSGYKWKTFVLTVVYKFKTVHNKSMLSNPFNVL